MDSATKSQVSNTGFQPINNDNNFGQSRSSKRMRSDFSPKKRLNLKRKPEDLIGRQVSSEINIDNESYSTTEVCDNEVSSDFKSRPAPLKRIIRKRMNKGILKNNKHNDDSSGKTEISMRLRDNENNDDNFSSKSNDWVPTEYCLPKKRLNLKRKPNVLTEQQIPNENEVDDESEVCNNRLSSELEFDPAPSRSITRKRPNKEIPEKNKHNDDGNARTSKRKRNENNRIVKTYPSTMQHPKPTQRKKNNKKSTKMRTSNDNLTNGVSDLAQENCDNELRLELDFDTEHGERMNFAGENSNENHESYTEESKRNNEQLNVNQNELSFESNDDDDAIENVDMILATSDGENYVIKAVDDKRKRNKFTWVKERVTQDLDEAIDAISEEGFKLYSDHDLKCGQKFYFRCEKIPKCRKIWCNRRYTIFLPSNSTDVVTLSNGLSHNHNELLVGKKRPISTEMTEFIFDFYNEGGSTPSAVLAHIKLAREKFNLFEHEGDPDLRQLQYMNKKYVAKHVKPMIHVGDLMEWCRKHSEFPKNSNDAFVLAHESCGINETMSFRFSMSTPLMLLILAARDKICIDATYKLNWMGYPLIIMGTVDRAKHFHPLIYACSSHERTEDYEFVFRSVKDAIRVHIKKIFRPKVLVADGADSIRNAFYTIFPNAEIDIMCFAHVLRNIRKRPFSSKNNKSLILDDIKKIQLAPSRQIFDEMAKLFCEKWRPLEENFVDYFKAQWLGAHSNWFEGAAVYTPSTNNALESHNAVIKRKITFRKQLPLNKFLLTMKEMTENISQQLSDEKRVIEEEPVIQKETWTKAAMMHAHEFTSFKARGNNNDNCVYVLPSSNCDPDNATSKYYKCLLTRQWRSFDEFINFGFQQFWLVTLQKTEWKAMSTCTCPSFFKQHMCKHILAIAAKEKIVEFPQTANPVPLTKRKKAGRVPNAKKALEYQ